MSFSDKTWSTGEVLTAANLNTYLRDNMRYVAGSDRPHCRVYRSTTQTIGDASATAINFDTERTDVGTLHSTSSNTDRITVPAGAGGFWLVGGSAEFAANATGYRWLQIRVNGSASPIAVSNKQPGNGSFETIVSTMTLWPASAGDYFTVAVYQNSGGNLNVQSSSNYSAEAFAIWMCV